MKTNYIILMAIGTFIVLLLIFIFSFFKNPINTNVKKSISKKIGAEAEENINKKIYQWSQKNNSLFIPSSLYKYNENTFFEVDSILITDKAIIVIEIKSISGYIFGSALSETWVKNKDGAQFSINNAIVQNEKHISHIQKMIQIKVPLISLIVFSDRVDELNIENIPSHVALIKEVNLEKTLDEIHHELIPKITFDFIKKIYKSLLKNICTSKKDFEAFKKIVGDK